MKRRILCACMLIILVFSFILPAYAADMTEYTLDDVGISVSLPSDFIAFTRDINENDPNLNAYGYTKESLSSFMTSKDMYLMSWDKNLNYKIFVSMQDSPYKDFNLYSDEELSEMAESGASEFEGTGLTYLKSEVYQNDQTKFTKIYITLPNRDTTEYGLEYITSYNGKAIMIIMSYPNQITSSEEATLKSIIDSIVFNAAPQTAETAAPAGASTYTDPKTQTTFTVPKNWEESPSSNPQEYIDVMFTSSEDPSKIIMFGSYDIWGTLTAEEQAKSTRSDVDNVKYTEAQIAEMFGIPSDNVSMVTYGGIEYYKMTFTSTDPEYSSDNINRLLLLKNGYMYAFQFLGDSDSEYYDDFEAMVSSVKYENQGTISSSAEPQIGNTETDYTDFADKYSAGYILLNLIITIVIYSLPIVIYRYAIKKEPVERKKAKKITIIYGIAAFIVMLVLIYATGGNGTPGGAIFLWSYVNYKMLIGGKKKPTVCVETPQAPVFVGTGVCSTDNEVAHGGEAGQDAAFGASDNFIPETRYCCKCGARLEPDSEFCSQCGEKQ